MGRLWAGVTVWTTCCFRSRLSDLAKSLYTRPDNTPPGASSAISLPGARARWRATAGRSPRSGIPLNLSSAVAGAGRNSHPGNLESQDARFHWSETFRLGRAAAVVVELAATAARHFRLAVRAYTGGGPARPDALEQPGVSLAAGVEVSSARNSLNPKLAAVSQTSPVEDALKFLDAWSGRREGTPFPDTGVATKARVSNRHGSQIRGAGRRHMIVHFRSRIVATVEV